MTSFIRALLLVAFIFGIGTVRAVHAQKAEIGKTAASDLSQVKSSPAYAELQLRRTELVSELESLLLDYNEEYPKIKELRNTISLVDRDIARISKVKTGESSKLTLALGKLMLRRIELEADLWNLQKNYKEEHPEVKRAKKKVEIYESAITDILN